VLPDLPDLALPGFDEPDLIDLEDELGVPTA
jgi:hypothetical protein